MTSGGGSAVDEGGSRTSRADRLGRALRPVRVPGLVRILVVHGVGHQLGGEDTLLQVWLPGLRDGLRRTEPKLAEADLPGPGDVGCAFYGDLFRASGTKAGGGLPPYDARDVEDEFERELLDAWWREAARVDPGVPDPAATTKLRTPRAVQRALNALSGSRFFAGTAERVLIFSLKQVRRYFQEPEVRMAARQRVVDAVNDDTRLVIGHSLGSVVAYEALAAHPEWPVEAFVSLGSPLGIRGLIFDRLEPAPRDGIGAWPGSVRSWVNIADQGDVVALEKQLGTRFGDHVVDVLVDNGARAHDVRPYLTAKETGDAVRAGLGR
ncbi:MAG: hypothetical protein ACRDYA_00015 [Egibacteraceae bacterium]